LKLFQDWGKGKMKENGGGGEFNVAPPSKKIKQEKNI
jgi:hypothetical protein